MSLNLKTAALAASALVLSLGAASHVAAATVMITSHHLATTAYKVNIGGTVDGNPFNLNNVYESPELFTVSVDNGPTENLVAFCVDLFHTFADNSGPLTYETADIVRNSDSPLSGGGFALSNLFSGEIGYLASLGRHTTDAARLAGIQGAIWRTEYSGLTFTGGSSYVDEYLTLAGDWAAAHPNFNGYAPGIFAVDGQTQGFVFIGTPEPGAWTMMILGFGLLGAALRRRRAAAPGIA